MRDPHDAEDLVQETFMGAFRTRFRGESTVRTWLVQILVRRAGMLRRSRRRMPEVLSLDAEGSEEPVASSDAPGGAGADARLDLSTMLEQLSPEHRQVIVLRELQGMTYEQIAEALQMMYGGSFRHVPVVENGRPVGMVSARDALGPELEAFVYEMLRQEQIGEILA